jgi:hypothetical protein
MLAWSKSQNKLIEVPDTQGATSSAQPAPGPMPEMQIQPTQNGGLASGVGNLILGLLKPFINQAENVGAAVTSVPQVAASKILESSGRPEEAARIASIPNPFQKKLDEVDQNPGQVVSRQLKDLLSIGSFAVPFGKGANIATKALIPGAAVGGLQGLSEDEVTPEKVVGNAALGATGAGLLHGVLGLAGKAGSALEKAGSKSRVGEIKLKPSLYGAESEKAVQETLGKYGVKGTPQFKYEKLPKVVGEISDQIETYLSKNAKPASVDDIRNIFMEKIKPAVRQGDITVDDAVKAFDDYFTNNVLPTSPNFAENPTTLDVFNLKKDVQASSSQVAKALQKAENKSLLTPKDKIMKTLRDSLDEVISDPVKGHPEIKGLTMDQSRLYDAVKPLASQRNTVPTVRALGITIPKGPVNSVKEAVGKTLEGTGKAASGVSNVFNNPTIRQILGQGISRTGGLSGGENFLDQSIQKHQDITENGYPNHANNNGSQQVQGELNHNADSIQRKITPEQMQEVFTAVAEGKISSKAASAIKSAYDIQEQAINSQEPATGKVTAKDKALANTGKDSLRELQIMLMEDPSLLTKQLLPGKFATRKFDAALFNTVDALLRLRTGAAAPESEVRNYMRRLGPSFGDSPEAILYKLDQLDRDFGNYLGQ